MQQPVQPQAVHIQRIGSQFACQFPEFLFNLLGHPHIKDSFHQGFDREQVGIDVFKIRHRLLQSIRGFLH